MSEFGTGFAYCLGLFLCHDERTKKYRELEKNVSIGDWPSMWFNGAADHLFDLQIPNIFIDEKKKEIQDFKDRCIHYRVNDTCTWKDVENEIQNAKDFLRQFDEALGIKSEKGDWE